MLEEHQADTGGHVHTATPRIADGVRHSLDPRFVALEKVTGWIASAVSALILFGGWAVFLLAARPSFRLGTGLGLAALILLLLLTVFWQVWPGIEYPYASYRVDPDGLEIREGVYFRSTVVVPRSRVQHTDVSQGPLQRRYGLATLTVHTAGTHHAEVELRGLPHDTALEIRDHLLPGNTADAV